MFAWVDPWRRGYPWNRCNVQNGGVAEALLPAHQGGLPHGDHGSDAEYAGTRGLEAHREGGDETDSGAVDEQDMECGPKATAGID